MELVGLSPLSSRPAADWGHAQRAFSHGCVPKRNVEGMTTQPLESVDRTTTSRPQSGTSGKTRLGRTGPFQLGPSSFCRCFAPRLFPDKTRLFVSPLITRATKALAIDRILRNDSLASLTQRGKSAPHRPPGVVGYCPIKHTQAKERGYREDRRYE